MTKLVSMYGKNQVGAAPQYAFSLFSMSGNGSQISEEMKNDPILSTDPRELSNVDAGIQVLYAINMLYPGITFGELANVSSEKLGKNIFEKAWDAGGDLFKGGGKLLSDTASKVGDLSGSAFRLLTDKDVREGIMSYAAGYATGGQSMALEGFLGGEGGAPEVKDIMNFLGSLGKGSKNEVQQAGFDMDFSKMDPKWMALGAGGLILLVLLLKK